MDNFMVMEVEILSVEVKEGEKGNRYVEFSGKSTESGEVFNNLVATGLCGGNLVKDFNVGSIVTLFGALNVNYDEDRLIEVNVSKIGYTGAKTKVNHGFISGILAYDPKTKKSKGNTISEIFLKVYRRDLRGNIQTFEGDDGEERLSRQMFKVRLTDQDHLDLLFDEIGKREISCASDSEVLIEYKLSPNREDGFVNIIPTGVSVVSLDSVMDAKNWKIPDLDKKSKKSKNKDTKDYSSMKRKELVKLAEDADIEDADDMDKEELIEALEKLDKKKSKKSKDTDTKDYSSMKRKELVKLAEDADIEDADDMDKEELIEALEKLDKKKSKKSKDKKETKDYSSMKRKELVELAEDADIEDADDMDKEELIEALEKLDKKKSKKSKDKKKGYKDAPEFIDDEDEDDEE